MSIENPNQKWRFWPVLCLAFIFAFASPLLMVATPLYFLDQGIEIKFISLLSVAITITYSVSPILLTKFSDRLGRRKSIIISMIGAASLQLLFFITLNPVVFLIERLLEGFVLGFFFPNLTASISDVPNIDHQKYLAMFNLSWSIAIIFGLIFGAIILLFTETVFIFYISPIILIVNIFIAIFLFQQPTLTNFKPQDNITNFNTSNPENNQDSTKTSNYFIPVIIPLLFILYTSFAAGNGSFLYPIRAYLLGFSDSSTYIVNIFAVVGQSITMYFASVLALNKLKLVSIVILSVYPFLFIFFIFNDVYFLFIILFLFSGFFYGMLYGAASKLFIALNVLKNTSKYSGILESSTGLTFFVSMLTLGFIADINVLLGYFSLTLSLLIIFFITLVFIRKLKEVDRT